MVFVQGDSVLIGRGVGYMMEGVRGVGVQR